LARSSGRNTGCTLFHRSALVVGLLGPLAPAAMADEPQSLGRIEVVGTAPLPGIGTPIEQVPSNIIAGWFAFKQAAFFEIENAAERNVPKVSFS